VELPPLRFGHLISRRAFLSGLAFLLATLVSLGVWLFIRNPQKGLPYHDSFASGSADEWKPYGGTWEVANGTIRNDSDERGAKLMAGSPNWRNYSLDADVELLGDGDAGLTMRASHVEEGVDSYSGYYAGLRTADNSLVIGLVDHGWVEHDPKPLPGGVHPFVWYHLNVVADGCWIFARATALGTGNQTTNSFEDRNCFASGEVGLRSYSSGGVWRNVSVMGIPKNPLSSPQVNSAEAPSVERSSASESVLTSLRPGKAEGQIPLERSYNCGSANRGNGRQSEFVQHISSLRYMSGIASPLTTVRGVVVLMTPVLYVQDSTGGVAIPDPQSPPLRLGDEVEVTGKIEPQGFSSTLRDATVCHMWAGAPTPPLSVTANQAATGSFDAMFVELEGRLRDKAAGPQNTWILDLEDGEQSFRAIVNAGRSNTSMRGLSRNSLLRLRGICVVDPLYTHNLTPFVVLLPSTEGVEVVAGPPWWSMRYLIGSGFLLLMLTLMAYLLYLRVKHWRLHAILDERERLAHEMHDTIAQSFAGIGFQLQAIRNEIPVDARLLHQQLDLASELARRSHEEARRSIAMLRPESLESAGLLSILESYASKMVEGGTVGVAVSSKGNVSAIPLRIKDTLFRIGQEAIANAIRHADSTEIRIEMYCEEGMVRLAVEDNGTGFTASGKSKGFGLVGMRKRAESISALLKVRSAPGQGTQVEVVAPLPPRLTVLTWPRYVWRHLMERPSYATKSAIENPYSYR
jgi:signal transduction histidine kinase